MRVGMSMCVREIPHCSVTIVDFTIVPYILNVSRDFVLIIRRMKAGVAASVTKAQKQSNTGPFNLLFQ